VCLYKDINQNNVICRSALATV